MSGSVFSSRWSTPGGVEIQCIDLSGRQPLLSHFPNSTTEKFAASDLSLGAWKGHWVAREYCKQLGIPMPEVQAPAQNLQSLESYGQAIGRAIDSETCGNRTVLFALDLANRILDKVTASPHILLLIAPQFGMEWQPENLIFVQFLTQGLRGTPSKLILVSAGTLPLGLPADWRITWLTTPKAPATRHDSAITPLLIPGILSADLAEELSIPSSDVDRIVLPNGDSIVAPSHRVDPRSVPRFRMTQLAIAAANHPWLAAYGHCFGHETCVDVDLLISEARNRSIEGSTGISTQLFRRAFECARSPRESFYARLRAQGTLIADFQFLELAQMPAPPDNVPANVRRFYQQNRAWGKVMTGQAGDAKVLFDEALQLFGTERESLEYLYLSNIRALSLLKSGDLIAALAAELEIGAVLQQSSRPDQRLLYVNSLNTARAYRNLGDYENAEVFIRKAFDTTYGVRSAPDLIYLNLYLGKIYSASGRHADALDSFIRAAIHWIVYSPPEALPARVLGLINGAVPTFQNCAQETANSWMRTLQVAAKNLGIVVTEKFNGSGPAFVSVDQLTKEQSKTLIRGVGIPGLGFILSDLKMDGVSRSPEFTILASFLANLLEARIPELSDRCV